jgi:pantothenate kinase
MDPGRVIDSFPRQWLARLEELPRPLNLNVAGYTVRVEIDREQLERCYLPVLQLLLGHLGSQRRIIAGLAGIPGSGKSTFAGVIGRIADALLGMGRLAVVGMDGWHWPNSYLDTTTVVDEEGRVVPLRQRKGGRDSFDAASLAAAIRDLQTSGGMVSLPVYSRRVHDPVPGGLTIGPGTSIVVVEGNFLLEETPPWDEVSRALHPRLFLECDISAARQRVIERHIRGGLSPEDAARKYEMNDRLNTRAVLNTRDTADYVIGERVAARA